MTRSRFHEGKGLYPPRADSGRLEKEIQSWEGFPWALRKEDLELWNAMVEEVRERFGEAVEASGKDFTTEPFFMALLLAQQKIIKRLQAEFRALGVGAEETGSDQLTLGC